MRLYLLLEIAFFIGYTFIRSGFYKGLIFGLIVVSGKKGRTTLELQPLSGAECDN